MAQKSRDIPEYDSEEAQADSDEEQDYYDPKQERVSRAHDQFLRNLASERPFQKIPSLPPWDQHAAGKGNMTILHYLLSNPLHCKLPFMKVRPLLDQLLNSDEKKVREFLSSKDTTGATALTLAVLKRRWDILLHILRHEGALNAARVQSSDGNNCLHEIILKRGLKNFAPMGDNDKELHDCIKLILSSKSKELITGQNKHGYSPLHLAVKFKKTKIVPEGQLELVSQLIEACPELLTISNNEDKSPYQYRLHTLKTSPEDDPIAFLLKDHYMHFDDRDEVIRYLYGKGGAG